MSNYQEHTCKYGRQYHTKEHYDVLKMTHHLYYNPVISNPILGTRIFNKNLFDKQYKSPVFESHREKEVNDSTWAHQGSQVGYNESNFDDQRNLRYQDNPESFNYVLTSNFGEDKIPYQDKFSSQQYDVDKHWDRHYDIDQDIFQESPKINKDELESQSEKLQSKFDDMKLSSKGNIQWMPNKHTKRGFESDPFNMNDAYSEVSSSDPYLSSRAQSEIGDEFITKYQKTGEDYEESKHDTQKQPVPASKKLFDTERVPRGTNAVAK